MMNFDSMTVSELRSYGQRLIREGMITHKNSRDVAMMNRADLITLLSLFATEPDPKVEPIVTDPKVETQVHEKRDDFLAEAIALAVEKYLKPTIDVNRVQEMINETLTKFDVVDKMKEVENYLNDRASVIERELMDRLLNLAPIKVQALDGTVRDVGLQHKMFEPILKLISQRQNVWMVGPSGSGKTHLAESVAKSLGLSFEAISVGLQTSKSDLFGYTDAHGTFIETGFFRCYKNGGVFLLDEVDNGNANVLAMINAATSNDFCGFPCGMTARHKDFVFVAAANTYGLGADGVYVGRNQIDGATRNRFAFVLIDYDEKLETALASNVTWTALVRRIRKSAHELKEKVIASPRASIKGSQALELGFSTDECLDMFIFQGIHPDVKSRVLARAQ